MSADVNKKREPLLFEEFESATKERWLKLVNEDLRGADFEKKLVWKSYEGFSVQPMYFREDIEKLSHLGSMPGFTPYVRGSTLTGSTDQPWSIAQTHDASDIGALRDEILKGVEGGERRVGLRFHEYFAQAGDVRNTDTAPGSGVWIANVETMKALCEDFPDVDGIDLYAGYSSPVFLAVAAAAACIDLHAEFDPVAVLATTGTMPWPMRTSFRLMHDSVSFAEDTISRTSVIGVSAEPWHNAGASAVEEVACVLATGVEYLHQLQERGLTVEEITPYMRFTFPVGTTFFMEVAKLRAARALWTKIVGAFDADNEVEPMRLHVCSSHWSKTVYDPYVNMLRSTVEAMAGAIGGAESMDIAPFDDVAGQPGPFSRRIARNVQVILQEESRLSHVNDPAAGSYYVEQLTDSVMQHAWEMFQEIEAQGGMIEALKKGSIQERISGTAGKKKLNISRRHDVIVGTNQYPNLGEKPLTAAPIAPMSHGDLLDRLKAGGAARGDLSPVMQRLQACLETEEENSISAMREALAAGMTVPEILDVLRGPDDAPVNISALQTFRAAEEFENLRNAVETCARKQRVFLATYGPVQWSRARATFSSGFFGAAGMDVVDNLGFASASEAAAAAVEQRADIVVACSEDANYRDTVPEIMHILRASETPMLLIVAGNPVDDLPALRAAGMHACIHLRTDVGATLTELLRTLGIEIQ